MLHQKNFPDDVKVLLRDRLAEAKPEWGREDIPYLKGALDAGCSGAAEVIAAIQRHGTIEIWCEN